MCLNTEVEIEFISATHDKIPNKVLAEFMYRNLAELGPPKFTREEHDFVNSMLKNVGADAVGLDET